MPPGSTITYLVQTTAPTTPGTLSNAAVVTTPAGETDTNPANNTATDTDTVIAAGTLTDLQITDNVVQTPVIPGTAVSYTIVATNAGPAPVTGAVITDAHAGLGHVDRHGLGWRLGFLGLGLRKHQQHGQHARERLDHLYRDLRRRRRGYRTISNTATITDPSTITDSNPANNVATDTETLAPPPANPVGDLQVTINDGQTNVVPGAALTYTIVASNAGPNTISGAVIADTLPASLTNVSYTATATGDAAGFWSASGNINQPVTMPPGSTITYTVSATVAAGATGTIVNTATITPPPQSTDPNPANNSATRHRFARTASRFAGDGQRWSNLRRARRRDPIHGRRDERRSQCSHGPHRSRRISGHTHRSHLHGDSQRRRHGLRRQRHRQYQWHRQHALGQHNHLHRQCHGQSHGNRRFVRYRNRYASDDCLRSQPGEQHSHRYRHLAHVHRGSAGHDFRRANQRYARLGPHLYDRRHQRRTERRDGSYRQRCAAHGTYRRATYTATTTGGATGFTPNGTGSISDTLNMPSGSTVTYVVSATLNPAATGTLFSTATVTAPVGVTDPNTANNTAADTDTLTPQADLQITNTDGKTTPRRAPTSLIRSSSPMPAPATRPAPL